MKRLSLLIILSAIILNTTTHCNHSNSLKFQYIQSTEAFNNSLVKQYSSDHIITISLPKNYKLKASQGIDFNTYYFLSSNKKDSVSFRGGIYLGNAPGYFTYEHCLPKDVNGYALNEPCIWQIDSCNNKFRVQTIVQVKNNSGWNSQIHLFGSAHSKNEMYKLLDVFRTVEIISRKAD